LPPKETLGFVVQCYGMLKWSYLFNPRQRLALIMFTEKVRLAHNIICRWANQVEAITASFSKPALSMAWDSSESNPFSYSTGDWNNSSIENKLNVIKTCSLIDDLLSPIPLPHLFPIPKTILMQFLKARQIMTISLILSALIFSMSGLNALWANYIQNCFLPRLPPRRRSLLPIQILKGILKLLKSSLKPI